MFNKTNKPAQPVPARPQPPVAVPVAPVEAPSINMARTKPIAAGTTGRLSSFGTGLLFEGNISGGGDLHIDGTVRGDVKVGHLVVGESGSIEGKVEADTIEVRGRIVGAISGKQVKLQATAYVEGDITHEALAIDVGAYFQGRCLQARRPTDAPATSSPATFAPQASAPQTATSDYGSPSLSTYDMSALGDLK